MKTFNADILSYLVVVRRDYPKLHNIFNAIRLQFESLIQEVTALSSSITALSEGESVPFIDQFNTIIIKDEFAGGGVLDLQIGENSWEVTENGVNAINSISSERYHPGIVEIELAANTDNYYDIALKNLSLIQNDAFSLIFLFRIPTTVTNQTVCVGLGSAGTDDNIGAEGIFLKYDSGTANWIATVRTGSTSTTIDSGIAVAADTWYKLEIKNVGGVIQFYINDQLVTGFDSGFSTTLDMYPRFRIKTKANEAKKLHVDNFVFQSYSLGNRY